MEEPIEGMVVVAHAVAACGLERQEGVVTKVWGPETVNIDVGDMELIGIRFEQSDPMLLRMPTNYEFYCFQKPESE
jgi:hypothetical protein